MDRRTLDYYDQHAAEISAKYRSIPSGIDPYIAEAFPQPGSKILDVGSGSGRDLVALLARGYDAHGIEPSEGLRKESVKAFPQLKDRVFPFGLPLPDDATCGSPYDGIVCSAVLMHIPEEQLFDAAFSLKRRLKDGGRLLVSVSHDRPNLDAEHRDQDGRLFHPVPPDYLLLLFERLGFALLRRWDTPDRAGREGIQWVTFFFELQGANRGRPLDRIETVLNRDRKTATYKLALFRAVSEIGTKEYQHARWLNDKEVAVPIRLIAEKWFRYYWSLFDADVFVPQNNGESPTSPKPVAFRKLETQIVRRYKDAGRLSQFTVDLASQSLSPDLARLSAPGSTDIIAQVAAPDGWYPGLWSEDWGVVWLFEQWTNSVDSLESWGEPEGGIIDPTVTLTVLLANAADYDTYSSNVVAQWEAQCQSSDAVAPQPMLNVMAMDEEDDDGGDPCTITNEAAPFSVVSIAPDNSGNMILTWQSCTDHIYVVQSESSLTPTSSWTDVAWMFGTDQQTSWTDTNAVGLTQNFYQVVRLNPNAFNNGIPYWWAVTYGLDPLDPNLASETSTNPWAHGLTNLQVYENPSVLIADNYSSIGDGIPDWWRVMYFGTATTTNGNSCATCDPDGDGLNNLTELLIGTNPNVFDPPMGLIVNGGNPCTPSLTISIQALSTNYPDIRASTDPLMSNSTFLAFSGGVAAYTLPDNGDGLYNVYVQYADATGQPHGLIVARPVTLDRVLPVIQITSPASNAVLNQAFITLQAVAADPNPVVPDAERPLSIWVNGEPYWDRDGTNIVVERLPVPTGTNSFSVTIQAVDQAGNTNTASETWPIDLSTATNAPNMLTVNLSSSMLLPNVSSIWVEGTVDNDYALINAIVFAASGDVLTNSLNVSQNQYEGLVSLEGGTNQLVLVASDAAGNASSNSYTVISSTEFSGAITNPVFGTFATAPSNYVSGYVSALYDAGLPTQTNVTSVTVNGVAAVLGTNMDAYGNVPFWTTNMIPLGVPITATIGGPGIPTDPPVLQAQSQSYEVIAKSTVYDLFPEGEAYGASRPSYPCGWTWFIYIENDVISNEFDLSGGEDSVVVNEYQNTRFLPDPGYVCAGDPDNAASLLGAWSGFEYEYTYTDTNPVRSLDFGSLPRASDWWWPQGFTNPNQPYYARGNTGWEEYWPWENEARASLTFKAPPQYGTNTTVIFTFEGMQYATPGGATQDLSQVQFRGQSPIAYSNEAQTVSYLFTVTGGQKYTINQDSFTWPSFTTNYVQQFPYATLFYSDTLHHLSWTNFHNAVAALTIYVRQPVPGTRTVINGTDAGHTSWQLSLTPTNQIDQLIPPDVHSFATGVVNQISGFGTTGWQPLPCLHETGPGGVFHDPLNANVQRTYNLTLDQLISGLRYAQAHANDQYDLDNYNCTDFALGVASHSGVVINSKLGHPFPYKESAFKMISYEDMLGAYRKSGGSAELFRGFRKDWWNYYRWWDYATHPRWKLRYRLYRPHRFQMPESTSAGDIAAVPVPSGKSAAQELTSDPEYARVAEIGRQWRGLTAEAVRAKYQAIQETNFVPSVLNITAHDDQNGDELVFSFEGGQLFEVAVDHAKGGAYQMFLDRDGNVSGYSHVGHMGLDGLSFNIYTNGQLASIGHFTNSLCIGEQRYYNESGSLVFSTNYTQPTLPEPFRAPPSRAPVSAK
jgi:SAM-dependent methyltransferase